MKRKYSRTLRTAGFAGLAAIGLQLPGTVAAYESTAQAEGSTTIQIQQEVIQVTGRLGLGHLSGETVETVYTETGHKLSELIWKIKDVYMLNAGISVSPKSWLTINADVWFRVNNGNGSMDDYDWIIENFQYTHWSHHDDTDLTEGYMIDLNAAFAFYQHGETTFSALAGYKRDNWEWVARGGSYVYSTYTLYDTVGVFPAGEKGITYKQWYDVPYIGLAFHSKLTKMSFSGRFIISPYAMAGAEDTHHMRDLVFEDDFDPTTMWAVDLGASYHFTPQLAMLGNFHYQDYDEAQGSTTIINQVTGARQYYPGDVAGTSHKSSLLSLSLLYNF
jgi:plasminogen activator